MGKTYKRNQFRKPKNGKDFKRFKHSNKFKKWNEKPHHHNIKHYDDADFIEKDDSQQWKCYFP